MNSVKQRPSLPSTLMEYHVKTTTAAITPKQTFGTNFHLIYRYFVFQNELYKI